MATIIELALMMLIAFLIGCLISWFVRCVLIGDKTAASENKAAADSSASVANTPSVKASVSKSEEKAKPEPVTNVASAKKADVAKKAKPVAAKPKPATAKAKPAPTKVKKTTAPKAKPAADGKPTALKAARGGKKDDLKRIKGIGPKIETNLNNMGVFHFDQIAGWSRKTVSWVDESLSFRGRIDREKWISQAKTLAKGDETEFSRRVDKG